MENMVPTQQCQPPQRKLPTAFYAVLGLCLGSLPGVLMAIFLPPRSAGIALALLGAFIGGAIGVYKISAKRVGRLFVATIIAKNIPGADGSAMDWVDEEDTEPAEDPILAWAFAGEEFHPRKFLVTLGMLVGLVAGYFVTSHDLARIAAQQPGIMLPLEKSRDSLTVQASMIYIACVIWGGSLAALVVSSFRRPLLLTLLFSLFLGGILSVAAEMKFKLALTATIAMATVAAGAALIVLFMLKSYVPGEEENLTEDDTDHQDQPVG